MNILTVNYEFPPIGGGGGIGHYLVARELARRHKVHVLTSHYHGLPHYEERDGIHVFRVPVLHRTSRYTATLLSLLSFPPPALWKGYFLGRKERYDIVHTYFAIPSGVAGVGLAKFLELPHVLTVIGGDIHDPTKALSPSRNSLLRMVVGRILHQANSLVAISHDTKRRTLAHYQPDKPVQVIRFGFAPPSSGQVRSSRFDHDDEDEFLIVSVGRLIPRKGFRYLIESLLYLGERNVRVLILGDGPAREVLQSYAEQLGLGTRVQFLGHVSEGMKFQCLSVGDAFVLPSIHEGFGLVFLEAMYCGLPIITTIGGGQEEFLEDSKTGFLVGQKDAQGLANKLCYLIDNPGVAKKMSHYNRQVAAGFTVQESATEYEALYSELVGSHGRRRRGQA